MDGPGREKQVLEAVAFNVAVLLAAASWVGAAITFHPDAETEGLAITVACGVAAIGWIAARWARVPRAVRPFGLATIGLTGLALLDAMRRLRS